MSTDGKEERHVKDRGWIHGILDKVRDKVLSSSVPIRGKIPLPVPVPLPPPLSSLCVLRVLGGKSFPLPLPIRGEIPDPSCPSPPRFPFPLFSAPLRLCGKFSLSRVLPSISFLTSTFCSLVPPSAFRVQPSAFRVQSFPFPSLRLCAFALNWPAFRTSALRCAYSAMQRMPTTWQNACRSS